jgi:nucleoside-diphosphate-sugar epimerase
MVSPVLLQNPALKSGSLILVTGVNGLIASHIADQLLASGYPVRGTVRSLTKNAWMKTFFATRHPNILFELVEVPDISKDGCFDEAVKGCAGVIHTTSSVELTATTPEPAIATNVRTVLTALEAAAKEQSVKRFVLTSSFWTASAPNPGVKFSVTAKDWNDNAVADAYSGDPSRSHGFSIFMAGKLKAEKACWDFMEKEKPGFVFNAVLPDTIFGEILSPEKQGIPSTAGLVKMLFDAREEKDVGMLSFVAPQWYIDVVDNAKLHIAALLHPEVKGERLLGAAGAWNWNDVLDIMRKEFPEKTFISDLDLGRDVSTVENERELKVLKDVFGLEEWVGLEKSIRENVKAFAEPGIKASFYNAV